MKLSKTDTMQCPHCSSELEGITEDYIVMRPLDQQEWCEDECVECYEMFKCILVEGGMVEVEKVRD